MARGRRAAAVRPIGANLNCPAIVEACNNSARTGVAKVAAILNVVGPAVGARVGADARAFLERLAVGPQPAAQ